MKLNKNYPNPWVLKSSQMIYQNPWLRLREDQVLRPDGNPGIYGVVELVPSVGIVAMNSKQEVMLVGQWRYTHAKFSWEIPTGQSNPNDPDLRASAARELREETGLLAQLWISLGSIDNSNGVTTDVSNLFLALDLEQGPNQPDPMEQLENRWVPFTNALEWVLRGEITESCSVSALMKTFYLRSQQKLDLP